MPDQTLYRSQALESLGRPEQVGRAMLAVARRGAPKRVLENADINQL